MSKAKLRAEAINRFVTDAKAQGVYDSLKAACILTGWDTLAGALTPLVGASPTNVSSLFTAADYDRGGQGLKGNGSTKYLNSNRANNADPETDSHVSVFASSIGLGPFYGSNSNGGVAGSTDVGVSSIGPSLYSRHKCPTVLNTGSAAAVGFVGTSRASASSYQRRNGNETSTASHASNGNYYGNIYIYAHAAGYGISTHTLSWYSIGSSVDLAALDTLVTRLMADLRAIEEDGMDRDALAYIRAVEAADGSFMVTGVKNAVDRLVKGLKYDRDANGRSAWDAIGASCLLCGPRTIAGALVPLKGVAPTAQGAWTSSDYNQETGLKGNGSTLYLDTNRANNADGQNDQHLAAYVSTLPTLGITCTIGNYSASSASGSLLSVETGSKFGTRINSTAIEASVSMAAGLCAASRQLPTEYQKRAGGVSSVVSSASASPTSIKHTVFALNGDSSVFGPYKSDARLAFYSIGASLSLSALDSRITKYVSDVAAAIP